MITHFDIVERLLVAALFGSIIGFERERLMWAAGIRTHMLVSVGSCLLMIVSAYGFQSIMQQDHVVLDPSRIAAQVVSGIGFLGAGSIIFRNQVVRGLTTAASIWSVAAIGLAAGGGLYFAAGVSTIIIFSILAGLKPLEDAYRARVQSCTLRIEAEEGVVTEEGLKRMLGVRGSQIRRFVIERNGPEQGDAVSIGLVRVSKRDIDALVDRVRQKPGIIEVDVIGKPRVWRARDQA